MSNNRFDFSVLPDGLVVEATLWNRVVVRDATKDGYLGDIPMSVAGCIVAYNIMGAHPDYAEHANELDMPVVEL